MFMKWINPKQMGTQGMTQPFSYWSTLVPCPSLHLHFFFIFLFYEVNFMIPFLIWKRQQCQGLKCVDLPKGWQLKAKNRQVVGHGQHSTDRWSYDDQTTIIPEVSSFWFIITVFLEFCCGQTGYNAKILRYGSKKCLRPLKQALEARCILVYPFNVDFFL